MKIIDAHMHYYDIDKFYEVRRKCRDMKITAACWQQICQENNIVLLWRWVILKMRPVVTAAVHRD